MSLLAASAYIKSIQGILPPTVASLFATGANEFNWNGAMSDDGTSMVFSSRDGFIYFTRDSGVTWSKYRNKTVWVGACTVSADGSKMFVSSGPAQTNGYSAWTLNGGATWTAQTIGAPGAFTSAACSADGSKLIGSVYREYYGANGYVYISSTSGATWTRLTALPQARYTGCDISVDGTRMVVVAEDGPLYISSDSGSTWATRESVRNWRSAILSGDGTKIVAVAFNEAIYLSSDFGETWVQRDEARHWSSVQSSNDFSVLVAFAAVPSNATSAFLPDTSQNVHVSVDLGETWSPKNKKEAWRSISISGSGSKIVGTTGTMTNYYGFPSDVTISSDAGTTWSPIPVSGERWQFIGGSSVSGGPKIICSEAEMAWCNRSPNFSHPLSFIPHSVSRNWIGVTVSTDGSALAAIVNGGQIYTSTNSGVNWNARESSRNWTAIAGSSTGATLVAVADGGEIFTSTNSGGSWTPRDAVRSWKSVAVSTSGVKMIAAEGGAAGQLYTSIDSGVTWVARKSVADMQVDGSPDIRSWKAVASSADGTKLIAAVQFGRLWTSTDSGVTWVARETERNWAVVSSSSDGTRLLAAVSGGQLYVSNDSGETWTARYSPKMWKSVFMDASGAEFWAVADDSKIYSFHSVGTKWYQRGKYPSGGASVLGMAGSTDCTHLIATCASGIIISHDTGFTWTRTYNLDNDWWRYCASSADGTRLVAAKVSGTKQIYRSEDSGNTWSVSYATGASWSDVAMTADGWRIMAVSGYKDGIYSQQSKILISDDAGATWTGKGLITTYWGGVACSSNGGYMYAVTGSNGFMSNILYSLDYGSTWSSFPNTRGRFASIECSSDGRVIVVILLQTEVHAQTMGATGVWVSTNWGATWQRVSTVTDGKIEVGGNTIAIFPPGNSYTYVSSDNGATWVSRLAQGSSYGVVSADGNTILANFTGSNFYISKDGGTY